MTAGPGFTDQKKRRFAGIRWRAKKKVSAVSVSGAGERRGEKLVLGFVICCPWEKRSHKFKTKKKRKESFHSFNV